MRKLRQIGALCLALVLVLMSVPPMETEARYTYTIRIFAGQQGTIGGGEMIVYEGLNYGDRVSFNLRDVTLNDNSKYYVKGIRWSGRDNNTVGTTSFQVTEDRDYVVAYGLLTDAVAYTINYVDAAGNALAPSETYYGNVGDRPVIAYLYIAGYQPQAYNLTGTLSENAAENIFNFVYTPVGAGGVTVIPGAPGGGTVPGGPGAPGGPGGEAPVPPEEQNIPDNEIPGGNTEGGDNTEGGENAGNEQPREIVDINEGEIPQASLDGNESDASLMRIPLWAKIGAALLMVALVGGAVWYIMKSGKAKKAKNVKKGGDA